jgi:hypothetical protein
VSATTGYTWTCPDGHASRVAGATCGEVVSAVRCEKLTPCKHSRGHCPDCGLELRLGCRCASRPCGHYLSVILCQHARPCVRCGSTRNVRMYIEGLRCAACVARGKLGRAPVCPYEVKPLESLTVKSQPLKQAEPIDVGESGVRDLRSLVKQLEAKSLPYDIRESIGPKGEKVVCLRVRLDGVSRFRHRMALTWMDGRFWMAIEATAGAGMRTLNLGQAKAQMGWEVKPRAKKENPSQMMLNIGE